MSISTTAHVTVAPTRRQLLANVIARASSRQLLSLAAATTVAQATSTRGRIDALLAGVEARTSAIGADEGVREALALAAPDLLGRSEALLVRCAELQAAGDATGALALAGQLDVDLRDGLAGAAGQLARVERSEATSALQDALETIGCHVSVVQDAAGNGIWAEREHQIVAVLVEDGGRATIDIAGCDGDTCSPLHRELEQAIAAQGGRLEIVEVGEHRDPRGGGLIRRAGALATDGVDLARAVVRQAVPAGRFARASAARVAPRPQRIREG